MIKFSQKAFSLIELMVIVAVIAVLTAIAIPNMMRMRVSSNDVLAQATLKTISTALENYMVINSQYPSSADPLLTVTPPYLNRDYFTGTHAGFTFTPVLDGFSYQITATPEILGTTGSTTFTIRTGGVLEGG